MTAACPKCGARPHNPHPGLPVVACLACGWSKQNEEDERLREMIQRETLRREPPDVILFLGRVYRRDFVACALPGDVVVKVVGWPS